MIDNEKAVDLLFNLGTNLIFDKDENDVAVVRNCKFNRIIMDSIIKIGKIDIENQKDYASLSAIIQCGRMHQLVEVITSKE